VSSAKLKPFLTAKPEHGNRRTDEQGITNFEVPERYFLTTNGTNKREWERGNKRIRFGVKRKKENELSFYALHQNQLLSEVLFSTARFVSKTLPLLRLIYQAPLAQRVV